MKLPNFIIIGAAKAGTSSIYSYLSQHPDIYCSTVKEPSYYAFRDQQVDFKGPGDYLFNEAAITNSDDYRRLFEDAKDSQAVGEASVIYLHSPQAAVRICESLPEVKIIVILRNPVDRAFSSYSHLVRDGYEPFSFIEGLEKEEERKRLNWQHLWHYKSLGFYHEALTKYFDVFPRESISVYLYDDFITNPNDLITNIFQFIGVNSSFTPNISIRKNVGGNPQLKFIHQFMMRPSSIKNMAKQFISQQYRVALRTRIDKWNIKSNKSQLTMDLRAQLQDIYRSDIEKTQLLIRTDLTSWL